MTGCITSNQNVHNWMGIELEEKVPMEVIIKMTETGPVYKNTKTGLHYHKVKIY